jgi:two-component system, NtrC family, nitrogen regulation sensor histidine kinase NtrY
MKSSRKRGPRLVGAFIIVLIIVFFAIEFYIRESQEISPASVTKALLSTMQIIVLLLFLVLFFVLGRNLVRLYLDRKRNVVGSHFKTRLVLFFIALSFIPTLLLFFFASDLISRNIEIWFKTPFDKVMEDTQSIADGLYAEAEQATQHYAAGLARDIQRQKLIQVENRLTLRDFIRRKLSEYALDEIGIYLQGEELFTYLNPNLPLQNYKSVQAAAVLAAEPGGAFRSLEPMGNGEMVRRGVVLDVAGVGRMLVAAGKFFPQSYTQKISNINSYVRRYNLLVPQKITVKTLYLFSLMFITLLLIFAASWIGFHLSKGITVPIEKLALATKEVSRGNLSVQVVEPANDELGTLIDSFNQMITDLKNSQTHIAEKTSELENRKQYIETVLNNIATGVITLDAEGRITTINPSAREMLALGNESPVGRSFPEVLQDMKYTEILNAIDWGLKNRLRQSDKEITIMADGQPTTLALALSPLPLADGRFSGMIVVFDDLTQLIKAQKIATWKDVAQRVAHEINNPLTPIQLSAERIIKTLKKNDGNATGVIEEGARTIIQETRAIKSMVDEFSNFARMPKVQLKSCDLKALIEEMVSLYHGIYAQVDVRAELVDGLPDSISLDPEQMKRVLINIFDNAIEAMNNKGRITVRAVYEKPRQRVQITVSDTGPGVPAEDRTRLFLPYFSTKKKGTGLGLAIVSQIIREHNGSIQVEDNQPTGAKFIIQLPA